MRGGQKEKLSLRHPPVTSSSTQKLGETGTHEMTLSIGYIKDPGVSSAWLGSLFAHEGQHSLNRGAYTGENLWKNEQRAGRVQLGVGNKIGFTQTESRYLKSWIADSNKEAMQKAMTQGYNHP
jgi:hypothetical protein